MARQRPREQHRQRRVQQRQPDGPAGGSVHQPCSPPRTGRAGQANTLPQIRLAWPTRAWGATCAADVFDDDDCPRLATERTVAPPLTELLPQSVERLALARRNRRHREPIENRELE